MELRGNIWHVRYAAATIALDRDLSAAAVTLQQHNHPRMYPFGLDIPLPADGGVLLEVAIRSNALSPHVPGRTQRHVVPRPDPPAPRYLMTGRNAPLPQPTT